MGFFDKVKKVLGSKKEDVESQNNVNDEVIDEPTFTESMENNDEGLNENEEIQSDVSEEIPANEETDKSIFNEKFRNFKYLDDLIHSGVKEIVLDSDIILNDEDFILYGIRLDIDDMIIDGNGHTIDACGKSRIFHCTANNISIKNITLKNGCTKEYGGAIYNECGVLNITESTFKENTAKIAGGALYNHKGHFNIVKSNFSNNKAKFGGAIRSGRKSSITNSTFYENNSTVYGGGGGAIDNFGRLDIFNSKFIANESKSGGAIRNYGAKLNIVKSLFTQNYSSHWGIAIISENGKVTIFESQLFENNSNWGGGTICNDGGELKISKSIINNNSAKYSAAILHNDGNLKIFDCEILGNESPNNIILNKDLLQVYNTDFRDNKSKQIILTEGEEANLTVNAKFMENDVGEAIIFNSGKFCTIDKCVFESNLSSINSLNIINHNDLTLINPKLEYKSKTILNEGYIIIQNSSLNIESKIYGGGKFEFVEDIIPSEKSFDFGYLENIIHECKNNEIILDRNICFENYEKNYYEGGIELGIDNLIIDGRGKTIDGRGKTRIFIITGKNILLKNITFKNGQTHKHYENRLNNNGGAIKINYGGKVTLKNCHFINNASDNQGGAIFNSRGELSIIESSLKDNAAVIEGGVIYNQGGEVTVTEVMINKNNAKCGGVFYNNEGNLTVTKSTIEKNTANGSIVYNNDGVVNIVKSELRENTKNESQIISNFMGKLNIIESNFNEKSTNDRNSGGGAVVNTGGNTYISKSTFVGFIDVAGGVIYNKGVLKIAESKFNNNAAYKYGGVIYNSGGSIYYKGGAKIYKSKLTITNSIFCENTSRYGGVIHNNGGEKSESELTIVNSKFNNNKADSGGVIYNKGEVTIKESTLGRNTAENGGSISNHGEVTIKESTLGRNTAENGGSISNHGELTIYKSKLVENISNSKFMGGGAIYNTGELKIKESSLNNNMANNGGAINNIVDTQDSIYGRKEFIGTITIFDSTLEANNAIYNGGAIYNQGEVTIKESALGRNTAEEYGGAIYLEKSKKYESKNCTFKDNEPDDVYEEK